MPKETIKFTVRQDGQVTEEVIGSLANKCEQLTGTIESKLGTVTQRLYKPEYYQTTTTPVSYTHLRAHETP